jgi:hypothetical protein
VNDERNALDPPAAIPPALITAVAISPADGDRPLDNRRTLPGHGFLRDGYSMTATLLWLGGSLLVLTLASVLSIGPQRRIYFPGIRIPVPETCALYSQFGLDCPGCGLTRSFIHFADGNWLDGLQLNPAGVVIFLFVTLQIPAGFLRIITGRHSRSSQFWARANEYALIGLPSLTLVQWILRMTIAASG